MNCKYKRFLVFAGKECCFLGGVNDLVGSYETHEEAIEAVKSEIFDDKTVGASDWAQIVDLASETFRVETLTHDNCDLKWELPEK